MAWLCDFCFPSFVTPREVSLICRYPSRRSSWACSCSKKNSRKKTKSNVELVTEIREFMSHLGLPDSHVPSFKDFAENGRNDLANIVRRRGYKHIRDLLFNPNDKIKDGKSNILRDDMAETTYKDNYFSSKFSGFMNPSMEEKGTIIHDDLQTYKEDSSFSEGISQSSEGLDVGVLKTRSKDRSSIIKNNAFSSLVDEKVKKFILTGELETIEETDYERIYHNTNGGEDRVILINENIGHDRNGDLSPNDKADSSFDQDFNEKESQIDTEHLKSMLRQKELELSLLKEQIEKENLSLSSLQRKAEMEDAKTQELVLIKNTELVSTEESLSGLVEVEVNYCGEALAVEIAGSFNGWQHHIQLDPEPAIENGRSRKSNQWSALLWLYPGVYEIKFIVDGQWILDPQMEMVNRGHFCNNILRVAPIW